MLCGGGGDRGRPAIRHSNASHVGSPLTLTVYIAGDAARKDRRCAVASTRARASSARTDAASRARDVIAGSCRAPLSPLQLSLPSAITPTMSECLCLPHAVARPRSAPSPAHLSPAPR